MSIININMILYIDSTDFASVTYAVSGEKAVKKSFSVNPHESHEALKNLESFLKKIRSAGRRTKSEITKIIVNKGPGSYTGTRIGITHALALGFAWHVPVVPMETKRFVKELEKLQ